YLFAQAKARDMWQNPLLPAHLFVQAMLLGSAILLPFSLLFSPDAFDSIRPLMVILTGSSLVHLLMVCGEVTLGHTTTHVRLAVWEMTSGRYSNYFRTGLLLSALGGLFPLLALLLWSPHLVMSVWISALDTAGTFLALAGILLYEHAYVQAGQSVPLA